jgi:hypothetical protein
VSAFVSFVQADQVSRQARNRSETFHQEIRRATPDAGEHDRLLKAANALAEFGRVMIRDGERGSRVSAVAPQSSGVLVVFDPALPRSVLCLPGKRLSVDSNSVTTDHVSPHKDIC